MAQSIAAVVGLGNPGDKYARTRHNAGYWLVDELAARAGESWRSQARLHGEHAQVDVPGGRLHLLKPTTFMNVSGRAVRALADFYKLEPAQVLIVHDELDLPAGTARFKRGGGAGGHNGLKDTIRCLGPEFPRLRIGIGHPGRREEVLGYVLAAAGRDEQARLDHAIATSAPLVERWLADGWDRVVHDLHSAAPPG